MLMVAAFLVSCNGEASKSVRFVLPPEFTGPIAIIVDPENAVAVIENSGVCTIVVPDDGVVRVGGDNMLRGWITIGAVDSNGNNVGDVLGGREMVGSAIDGSIIWYYRGSVSDFNAFMDGSMSSGTLREWLEQRGLIRTVPEQGRVDSDT
jgi:hypothetical protein